MIASTLMLLLLNLPAECPPPPAAEPAQSAVIEFPAAPRPPRPFSFQRARAVPIEPDVRLTSDWSRITVEWPVADAADPKRTPKLRWKPTTNACCCQHCYDEYDECIWQCDQGDWGQRPQCYNNCGFIFDMCFWYC